MAAKYDGKGDLNSADSFVPEMTPSGANGCHDWMGIDLFRSVPLAGLKRTLYTTRPLIPAPPAPGEK